MTPWRSAGCFLLAALCAGTPAAAQEREPDAPAASSLSGYMELQYTKPEQADAIVDLRRFVLVFGHRFSERIRFVSEVEIEHALVEGLEEKGEVEVEQAYLDFLIHRRFNVRAGQILAPVGLINERHEPPVFHGTQRPFVDTFLIPTTWFDAGVGVFGEFSGGWRYRAFAMAPLDATALSADEGLAESSQSGSQATVRHWAGTGRVEYLGVPRLTLAASFWSGKTTSGPAQVNPLDPRVAIAEFDGRGRVGRLEMRGEFAQVFVADAAELNRQRRLSEGIDPNIARQMRGAYFEVAHPLLPFPSPREVVGFARYEVFDTQYRMPAGYLPLREFSRSAWIAGISYFPDPDVVVKLDYTSERSRSAGLALPRSLNIGLGWWF